MSQKPFFKQYRELIHYCVGGWRQDLNHLNYCRFLERWYAATIDFSFFFPLYVLFQNPFERYLERLQLDPLSVKPVIVPILIGLVPWILYYYLPTLFFGQTLGKKAVGIEVISEGKHRSAFAILVRETLGKFLSLASLGAGFLMAIVHPKRKTLHDLISKTSVVSLSLERGKGPRSLLD